MKTKLSPNAIQHAKRYMQSQSPRVDKKKKNWRLFQLNIAFGRKDPTQEVAEFIMALRQIGSRKASGRFAKQAIINAVRAAKKSAIV
jgi:hypothetical protein